MNGNKQLLPYFLPSIADILFAVLLFYLATSAGNGLLADGDTGYHIRAGEYILNTFSIPRQDIYSFITPPLQWTAHEWLSEVIMALIHRAAGLTGVVVFFSCLIAVTYYTSSESSAAQVVMFIRPSYWHCLL